MNLWVHGNGKGSTATTRMMMIRELFIFEVLKDEPCLSQAFVELRVKVKNMSDVKLLTCLVERIV